MSSFGTDKLNNQKSDEKSISRIQEAMNRIKDSIYQHSIHKIFGYKKDTKLPKETSSNRLNKSFDSALNKNVENISALNKNLVEKIKKLSYNLVEHRYFEIFTIFMIVLSSLFLVSINFCLFIFQ